MRAGAQHRIRRVATLPGAQQELAMPFELPELPFAKDALAPVMSAETLEFHHGKHHKAYVTKTNELVEGDQALSGASLLQVVRRANEA
jgi:Fe-Mn family superoxide dismutase